MTIAIGELTASSSAWLNEDTQTPSGVLHSRQAQLLSEHNSSVIWEGSCAVSIRQQNLLNPLSTWPTDAAAILSLIHKTREHWSRLPPRQTWRIQFAQYSRRRRLTSNTYNNRRSSHMQQQHLASIQQPQKTQHVKPPVVPPAKLHFKKFFGEP